MKGYLLTTLFLLSGCANSNDVELITGDSTVNTLQNSGAYEGRHLNIYRKVDQYPLTCTDNCYPKSELIECQQDMEQCKYVGPQQSPKLNTGFDITWHGHASFTVKTKTGGYFLFDPVFEQFDWPVNWGFRLVSGFNRQLPSNLELETSRKADAIMYSHIHYDHFNKDDIAAIGDNPHYLVPKGFADHLPEKQLKVSEMEWYAKKNIKDTEINFVPAHHFSNRIMVPFISDDTNEALWGGWILEQQGKTLFFAGDTGYSPHFKDIQARYGDIDVCLLPIASYFSEDDPKWYRYVHMTPEDALIAAKDLNCKVMIPWGYGNASWKMGDLSSHSALFRLLHMKEEMAFTIPILIFNEGDGFAL